MMVSVNFYDETLRMLRAYGKCSTDVLYVQTSKHECSMVVFLSCIKDFTYNNGYGTNYIRLDLKIVGRDWWLERSEYDGSERWVFKQLPKSIGSTRGSFEFSE